jgi:type IV secretion system protein VirD4
MFRRLRSATLDDLLVSLLIVVIGGLGLLTLLYWLTGQVAGRLFGGAWPHIGFVEMGAVMVDALRDPADPTSAWPQPAQELLPGPVAFYTIMFGLFVLPVVALILLVAVGMRGRPRFGRLSGPVPPGPVGTAPRARRRARGPGWASGRDLRRLQVRLGGEPGRLTLGKVNGRLVAAEPGQSVIVLGPPGSGKTTGLVAPALLEWDGPVVVATSSPELVLDTARRRGQLGGVWAFDPGGVCSLPRAAWSPLDAAGTWEEAVRTAGSLVTASAPAPAGAEPVRGAETASLLAPLLYAASRSFLGLGELARWVQRQDRDEVSAVLAAGEPAAADAFAAAWRLPETARDDLYAAAQQVLAPWADPRVRRALGPSGGDEASANGNGNGAAAPEGTRERASGARRLAAPNGNGDADGGHADDGHAGGGHSDGGWERFNPALLLDGGVNTLYLLAPAHDLQRLRPLLVTLLQEVVSTAYERGVDGRARRAGQQLLVVLDDAAEVAALRSLDVHASTAGGQGVQLVSVFRNVAQVRARYGERADNVITSHRARIVLSGTTDPATLDYLANLLGDERFRPPAPAGEDGGDGRRGRRARPPAPPPSRSAVRVSPADALRQPRPSAGLLIYGYLPPAELELRPWFRDRRLRALAGAPRLLAGRSKSRVLTPMAGRRPPRARDVFPNLGAPTRRGRQRP